MMFVSMVGHAIFQTAGRSGPSTMDRSYLAAVIVTVRGQEASHLSKSQDVLNTRGTSAGSVTGRRQV